ncbi:hypothetical protein FQA39_LY01573 [Lamprigera yunnana]|nr:hypothetical protein FQA39_LY01573 [Lamprigera yunnana]
MAFFVIAGKPTCPKFTHAVFIARYIEPQLPNFTARIIEKENAEWKPWLENMNSIYKWSHTSCPLIWKELSRTGGLPHYVGGLSEFWEYCYEYYDLQSVISPENLEKLHEDHLQYFESSKKKDIKKRVRNIGIVGTLNRMFRLLASELLKLPELQENAKLLITFFTIHCEYKKTKEKSELFIEQFESLAHKNVFRVVDKIDDVIKDCELLIIIGDYTRREDDDEKKVDWLERNVTIMNLIADGINAFANRDLKIIVGTYGPVCYDVSVLITACPLLQTNNIVGVTSDIGLGVLQEVGKLTGVNMSNVGAPPVWGYVGINQYVDIHSAVMYYEIYRPYQRMLTSVTGSTLPLGEIQPELRWMSYLLYDVNAEDVYADAKNKQIEIKRILGRQPLYSKIRSIISLISQWYAKEDTGDIISLGIYSNGSFGIPNGVTFSQPAILKNGKWVPFAEFPVKKKTAKIIEDLVHKTLAMNEERCESNSEFSLSSDASLKFVV